MAEQCQDCHWFKAPFAESRGGQCRFNPPGPQGFAAVLRDDRCGKFKLALSVPRAKGSAEAPAGRHGGRRPNMSTGGGDSAEGRMP
jgi:hypothetical protein